MTETSVLSPAQRAAETRRQNRMGGSVGATQAAGESRPVGMVLTMTIGHDRDNERLVLSFDAIGPDGRHLKVPGASFLRFVRWTAKVADGELGGFHGATLNGAGWDTGMLESVLPVMRRADKLLTTASASSEDDSFAFVAQTLAAHYRADQIRYVPLEGEPTVHKRGAAYKTALRAELALLATVKPEPIVIDPAAYATTLPGVAESEACAQIASALEPEETPVMDAWAHKAALAQQARARLTKRPEQQAA